MNYHPSDIPFGVAFQLTRRGPCRSEATSTVQTAPGDYKPLVGGDDAVHGWGKAQHFIITKRVDWATPSDVTNLNVSDGRNAS